MHCDEVNSASDFALFLLSFRKATLDDAPIVTALIKSRFSLSTLRPIR